jgi:hypothetical protein
MDFYEKQFALDEIGIHTANKSVREIQELYQQHIGLLDKHEAEQAMRQGKKVHRENWAVDEFLEIKDGQMYDEKGAKMNITYLNTHYSGWKIKND